MSIQSSYHSVFEQVLTLNNNLVNALSNITTLMSGSVNTITTNITDQNGVLTTYSAPSFVSLQNQINALSNNINSLYSINQTGALIQPTNGNKFSKIITIFLNREPNDIGCIVPVTNFTAQKNYFFDTLVDPQMLVNIDLSGQIDNNATRVYIRRYIAQFAKDSSGNYTPLGQSAINSFNNLFRNANNFSIDDFNNWYQTTPGTVNPFAPEYDEQFYDLNPNVLIYDGTFNVISITTDTVNQKLWYTINTLNYIYNVRTGNTITQQVQQLAINDEIILNSPQTSTRYQIIEINSTTTSPQIRLQRIEGAEPIPVGVATIKIYSPILYDKVVQVNIGYNQRNAIFVKALNSDTYIESKNWSKGIGFWSNDLTESSSGLSMEQYYIDNVSDYGIVLQDMVAKNIPNARGVVPNAPNLVIDNFKVVQTNTHLTNNTDSTTLKTKNAQQTTLKSQVDALNTAIQNKNQQLKTTTFVTDAAKTQFMNDLDSLNKQKASVSTLLSSVTSDILALSSSPSIGVTPEFSVRGFWSIPPVVVATGTQPQQVVQFRVQYRRLSSDGTEAQINTFKLADATTGTTTAAYSNWVDVKTDSLQRTFDPSTNTYSWVAQDITNPDTPAINQLSIAIQYGEQIEIRIKSISEIGWPDSPIESDWSNGLVVPFPTNLNNTVNNNPTIINDANKQDVLTTVQSNLTSMGLDIHLADQTTINNVTYKHDAININSGFKDSNGYVINLYAYINNLQNQITSLQEQIANVKGILQVVVFQNNTKNVVKNGSSLLFNIECEDYMDIFASSGVPSGRVYANNIYTIKDFSVQISNIATQSPLGLLSARLYATDTTIYNTSVPQVFWVDSQDQLITNNSTGTTLTQIDNQFFWSINYNSGSSNTVTALSQNIGNVFTNTNSNSITNVLSSPQYNIGYSQNAILNFIGSDNSLQDNAKWIDVNSSISSTTKLLTTVHPSISNLTTLQQQNSEKVQTVDVGPNNAINIPINIYFKVNALDNTQTGLNYQYVNFNSASSTVTHTKTLKFLLENQADNTPFVFTIGFTINQCKIAKTKTPTTVNQ